MEVKERKEGMEAAKGSQKISQYSGLTLNDAGGGKEMGFIPARLGNDVGLQETLFRLLRGREHCYYL